MDKKIIHRVFEFSAESFPEAIAIQEETRSITYAQLNRRANQLAHHLLAQGLEAERPVGLFLDEGIDYVVAMLAVLKAGGVFAPLHTSFPDQRLQAVLDRIEPAMVVSQGNALALRLSALGFNHLADRAISIDGPFSSYPETNIAPDDKPYDACYIITTSGSTGQPKAILGRHKSLSHFIHWEIKEFGFNSSLRNTWLSAPTFDVSLRDMFVPLLSGGTLCVPSSETRQSPARLLDWMERQAVRLTHIVPSLLRLLMQEMKQRMAQGASGPFLPALEHALIAGEPLYGSDVLEWRATAGTHTQLVNLYGPSETTLAKLFNRIGEAPPANAIVPLGNPISNTAVLILKNNRLCNIGEIGEIHIKTPFMSKGYLKEPEMNSQVFIQNPLVETPDIIYKTGDLGRYAEDRSIQFVGRQDRQIKVNGNRVELDEIERALLAHPQIRQAIVLPFEKGNHENVLAAYYRPEGTLPVEALKEALAATLPDYMLPSFFIQMEKFPLNLHGKIDRKNLPRPEELIYQTIAYRAPVTPAEQKLAAIWKDILGLQKVGMDNPFFQIGGTSLNAMKIIARIYQAMGLEISLRDFFNNPTIGGLAAHLTQVDAGRFEPIPVLEPQADYPLANAQFRLWTLDCLEEGALAYNIPGFYWIEGSLDVPAFEASFQELYRRHASLRATFRLIDGQARMIFQPADAFAIHKQDHRHAADPEAVALAFAREESRARFDLAKDVLIRVHLLTFSETRHLMAVNLHHIIGDAWSLSVLAREFLALYEGYRTQNPVTLPPVKLQYGDYVVWQNAKLTDEAAKDHRSYWLQKFTGPIADLELPLDFPRPPVQTFHGETLSIPFERLSQAGVARFAQAREVSTFMILLAGLKLLLHRYTGQEDIVVGTTIANREHPDLESLVGLFVNTLALRDRVSPHDRFVALLDAVKRTASEAYHHQLYPFDRLIEDLQIARDVSRSPLFGVGLVLHDATVAVLNEGSLAIREFSYHGPFSKFELMFTFRQEADQLSLALTYNTDLFTRATAIQMGTHLENLLLDAMEHPTARLSQLELLQVHEREALLLGRNQTKTEYEPTTLPDLFRSQAARFPDHVALATADLQFTYHTLNERTDQIAAYLLAHYRLEPEAVVAVLVEDRHWAVIAALAIFKAGGVYLPLDAQLPNGRLAHMLADAKAHLVLCQDQLLTRVLPLASGSVVGLESVPTTVAAFSATKIHPEHLAYLIYTSGSTGTPKGVMVSHGGFVNMALDQIKRFDVTPSDRVLLFASLAFDASLSEMFMALLAGAALWTADRETLTDPELFLAFAQRHQISIITLPPVYLAALAGRDLPFKTLITAGEAADPKAVARFADQLIYANAYGPTEFSVCATIHRPTAKDLAPIGLGSPIANGQVYLLDTRLELVAPGVKGEICVSGLGTARGYLGQPAKTAASFVPHPYLPGERLYRTGDLGRIRPQDGQLLFLGRGDEQVKIHGRRIEPGEIQATLLAHPEVGEAIVLAEKDESGTAALAAWYTQRRRVEIWPSVAEFFVYDDFLYGAMAQDLERNARYMAAFRKALPGKIVLEPGPGPHAILSRMCIEAGAAKVYAVELLESTFLKASALVKSLGLEDRIILIHGDIATVQLPERVDYCISEIVGGIGGSEGSAVLIEKTRPHLIDPTHMIPSRSLTKIAAFELPADELAFAFPERAAYYVRQIFSEAGRAFDLRLCLKNFRTESLLSDAAPFEDLDYTQTLHPETKHTIDLHFQREGKFTGFLVWLCLYTDNDNVVDVLENPASWLPLYLPIHLEGYTVQAGDRFQATITRTLCANGLNPDFLIEGTLVQAGTALPIRIESNHFGTDFGTDPFHARLFDGKEPKVLSSLSPDRLRADLSNLLPEYMVPKTLTQLQALPLTTNGKVDRVALPRPQRTASRASAPRNATEQTLIDVFSGVLGTQLGVEDHFFSRGGDSIKAIQAVSRLRDKGFPIKVMDLFKQPTAAGLAQSLTQQQVQHRGPAQGRYPLTPIQRWAVNTFGERLHHFNQAALLRLTTALSADQLQLALNALADHHDGLRTRLTQTDSGWEALVTAPGLAVPFQEVDLRADAQWQSALEEFANRQQASFDLQRPPLIKAALIHTPTHSLLLIVIHHLVVDGVSWRILGEDMETLCRQILDQTPLQLPARSDAFIDWAQRLSTYAPEIDRPQARAFWSNHLPTESLLPAQTQPPCTQNQMRKNSFVLDPSSTRQLIQTVPAQFAVETQHLLLAGLIQALQAWTGKQQFSLTLESHGRSDALGLDPTRTVGWFTSTYPLTLRAAEANQPKATWLQSLAQTCKTVQAAAFEFGILDARQPFNHPMPSEILFNYMGQYDRAEKTLFEPLDGPIGAQIHPDQPRFFPLEVGGRVEGGRLHLHLSYDPTAVAEEEMSQLTLHLEQALSELASSATTRFDLPLSPLQQLMIRHTTSPLTWTLQGRYRVDGALDPDRFAKVWSLLAQRHDVLRSRFDRGSATRQVGPEVSYKMQWLTPDQIGEGSGDLDRFLQAERQGITLSNPMSFSLIRWEPERWEIVWSFHHGLIDGWSGQKLLAEFATIYTSADLAPALPQPVSFQTYVAACSDASQHRPAWEAYLNGCTMPPAKPVLHQDQYGEHVFQVDAESTRGLNQLAQDCGTTLYTIVRILWGLAEREANHGVDPVWGTVVSHRPDSIPGIDQVVGPCISLLPFRLKSNPGATFIDLVQSVQRTDLELRAHHGHPQDLLSPDCHVLTFQNLNPEAEPAQLGNLRIQQLSFQERSHFELDIHVFPRVELLFKLRYNALKVTKADLDAVYHPFLKLVASVLADPASFRVR